MTYLEISLIIIVVVACVHCVHKYAYNQGHKIGIDKGRLEILQENITRATCQSDPLDLVELAQIN